MSDLAGSSMGGGLGGYFRLFGTPKRVAVTSGYYPGTVSAGLVGSNGYGTAVAARRFGDIANGFNATFVEVFLK